MLEVGIRVDVELSQAVAGNRGAAEGSQRVETRSPERVWERPGGWM